MVLQRILRPFVLLLILFCLFLGYESQAQAAQGYEPLDGIRAAALELARARAPAGAELSPGRLDERLRLPACGTPLQSTVMSDTGGAMSVEVRCDEAGWKLYVPVSVSLQVPVLMTVRPLNRGETVSAADVRIEYRDRAGLGPSWIGSTEQLAGQVLVRAVPAGALLTPIALAPEKLVRRGQNVTLVSSRGGFQVRAQGKALADGAAGDLVRVENHSSRRVVQGQVRSDGTVEIPL